MAEKPILFSAPMVRALLDDRKTQTRRIIKPQPTYIESSGRWSWPIPAAKRHGCDHVVSASREWHEYLLAHQCPWPSAGDRLWVKETWRTSPEHDDEAPRAIRPGSPRTFMADTGLTFPNSYWGKLRPSIFMPRWASRLTLIVEGVKIERLQDISEDDALAEGVPTDNDYAGSFEKEYCRNCGGSSVHAAFGAGYGVTEVDCAECETAKLRYRNLWEHINGQGSWAANPWIYAVSFCVIKQNIDQIGRAA